MRSAVPKNSLSTLSNSDNLRGSSDEGHNTHLTGGSMLDMDPAMDCCLPVAFQLI
jgi:hypothetical protein